MKLLLRLERRLTMFDKLGLDCNLRKGFVRFAKTEVEELGQSNDTEMAEDRKVDIVIVNWNGWHLLDRLLYQLLDQSVSRNRIGAVIVVDNDSSDGSAERIAVAFPMVRLVHSEKNLGYAGGNNLGLTYCVSQYVLFLNNDTEVVDRFFVTTLCEVLDEEPSVAAVGPALILPDGRYQTGVAGQDGSLLSFAAYFLFLSKLLPRTLKSFYLQQSKYTKERRPVEVDWVSGAAMMVRRDEVLGVGGMPDDFFMYAEDVKLCRLLRDRGGRVLYVPYARVMHHHGTSENALGVKTRWIDSTLAEYRARAGRIRGALAALIFCLGFFLRALAYYTVGLLCGRCSARDAGRRMLIYASSAGGHARRLVFS